MDDVWVASVLVINLAQSVQRLRHIQLQFAHLRLERPRRVPAIRVEPRQAASTHLERQRDTSNTSNTAVEPTIALTNTDLNEEQLGHILGPFFTANFQFRGSKGLVKLGDLSVALSHLRAWSSLLTPQALERSRARWHLILEDDAVMQLPAHVLAPRVVKASGAGQMPTMPAAGRGEDPDGEESDQGIQLQSVPEVRFF